LLLFTCFGYKIILKVQKKVLMDIAQYIGLILLKNEYCYLPGIGSLSVVKKPATFNDETKEINSPVYEVIFQKSIGSIDDAFANFIANNERISIAHASNHFKDYCARAKEELKEGREIVIPGIGSLSMNADQEITFTQDPHLQVKGKAIPFFRNSQNVDDKKKEEALTNIIRRTEIKEPKADEAIVMQAPQVNWAKIIVLIVVILAILAAIIYFLSTNSGNSGPSDRKEDTVTEQKAEPVENPQTLPAAALSDTKEAMGPGDSISYQVILNDYTTRERAERRVSQLQSYGNKVSLLAKDSTRFSVVMNMSSTKNDTTRIIDSLMRIFNPNGDVRIAH
jgi:nucleoid DNA-binding protein